LDKIKSGEKFLKCFFTFALKRQKQGSLSLKNSFKRVKKIFNLKKKLFFQIKNFFVPQPLSLSKG
jgi:hypothetical protein